MPATLTRLPRLTGPQPTRRALTRSQFLTKLLAVPGPSNVAFLFAPKVGDTTTATDASSNASTITHDADASGRISVQGSMAVQSYASASTQYSETADRLSLSFGNGTTDLAFSIVALVNVTDTAAQRAIIAKYQAGTREYALVIDAADRLGFSLTDQSANVAAARTSDAAVTQGALRLFAVTYDGTGGATAANGVALYQDAAVIASTATNNASYVAMENTTAPVEIGALFNHGASLYDGGIGFVMVCLGALSAVQLGQIKGLVNRAYGLAL